MMQVKFKSITTSKATFITFEKKLPLKGFKSNLAKEKIRKFLINKEHQVLNPIIFVKPEVLSAIGQKVKMKPFEYQIDLSEVLKSGFNMLKERLLKEFTS